MSLSARDGPTALDVSVRVSLTHGVRCCIVQILRSRVWLNFLIIWFKVSLRYV